MAAKAHFEYVSDWRAESMAYWVHVQADDVPWLEATAFTPAAPVSVSGKGYPVLCVEIGDVTLRFSSPEQLRSAIVILGAKPLPSTLRLSAARPCGAGPNAHWLSRLPAKLKSAKARKKVVSELVHALEWAETSGFGRAP